MGEFVSDGGDGAVTWQKNGFGRESKYCRTNRFESRPIAGADATDGAREKNIANNGKRVF